MKIKNEAELLNEFCGKDDLHPLLHTPFYNTKYDKVWCTNAYVLLEINPKVLTKKYHEDELRFPELEYPCKKKVTIEAINKALDECPKVDEEIVVSEEVKCKECEGSERSLGNTLTTTGIHTNSMQSAQYVMVKDILSLKKQRRRGGRLLKRTLLYPLAMLFSLHATSIS